MMLLWQDSTMNVKGGCKMHLDAGRNSRQQAEQVPNAALCKSKMTIDELTN